MKGDNLQHTLLSPFGGRRHFAVLGNEMLSVHQKEPLFQTGVPQQGIHVHIRGVCAAGRFVLSKRCIGHVLILPLRRV